MTYKSPIEIINEKVTEHFEDGVMKAVYAAEFLVDKYELYKALQYDRGQYEKGYTDRDHEIVRCKYCKFNPEKTTLGCPMAGSITRNDDTFCSWAVKKEEDEDL